MSDRSAPYGRRTPFEARKKKGLKRRYQFKPPIGVLPDPATVRWIKPEKERLIQALDAGLITETYVKYRFGLHSHEIAEWRTRIGQKGRSRVNETIQSESEAIGMRPTIAKKPLSGTFRDITVASHRNWYGRTIVIVSRGSKVLTCNHRVSEFIGLLVEARGAVVTTRELMWCLYGITPYNIRTVSELAYVARKHVRTEFGGDYAIESVWGRGYRIAPKALE